MWYFIIGILLLPVIVVSAIIVGASYDYKRLKDELEDIDFYDR